MSETPTTSLRPDEPIQPSTPTVKLEAPKRPEIPDVVIEGELGRGGMGVVYRGRQPYIDRKVAVKVLATGALGTEGAERFRREAKILANLQHSNIVACYQAGTTATGDCFLVMELVDGPNLDSLIAKEGALAEAHALEVVRDIALALEHARAQGIIHRDVKPENILLARRLSAAPPTFLYTAKLVDLGLARPAVTSENEARITTQGVVVGTPATMAIEQFEDPENVDFRADIYGLGCVLFHALTGRVAFNDRAISQILARKARGEIPDPLELNPNLSKGAVALVRKMLAPAKEDRHQSYEALVAELEQVGHLGPPRRASGNLGAVAAVAAQLAPPPPEKPPVPAASSGAPLAVVLLLTIAGVGAAAVSFSGKGAPPAPGASAPVPAPTVPAPAPAPVAPPVPAAVAFGDGRPLFDPDYKKRLDGWERLPVSAFGPEDEGPGVSAALKGRMFRPIEGNTWRVEGRVKPIDDREWGVVVDLSDGRAVGLVVQKLGAHLASVVWFGVDAQTRAFEAKERKNQKTLGKVNDELRFRVTVANGAVRLDAAADTEESPTTIGDEPLGAATPRGVSLWVNGSRSVRFRDVMLRRPEK